MSRRFLNSYARIAHPAVVTMFDLTPDAPIFHGLRIERTPGGYVIHNADTLCGRSNDRAATFLRLRHARLFGRPCRRCFR